MHRRALQHVHRARAHPLVLRGPVGAPDGNEIVLEKAGLARLCGERARCANSLVRRAHAHTICPEQHAIARTDGAQLHKRAIDRRRRLLLIAWCITSTGLAGEGASQRLVADARNIEERTASRHGVGTLKLFLA